MVPMITRETLHHYTSYSNIKARIPKEKSITLQPRNYASASRRHRATINQAIDDASVVI